MGTQNKVVHNRTVKRLKDLPYPLLLFLILSALLHLLAWSGFSGLGDSFILGINRASQGEVIDFLISGSSPPEPQTADISSDTDRHAADTYSVSEKHPSSKAGTRSTISSGYPTPETLPASSAEERKVAAEETYVSSVPHDTVVPVLPEPLTETVGTNRNSPAAADAVRETRAADMDPIPDILPFAREQLIFSLYWSGIHVGTATLEAVRGETASFITSIVHSNAVISSFYKVDDRAESRLLKGRPAGFTLLQSEGKHRGNKETIFEPERNRVTYINHLDKSRHEHDMSGKLLWDVISGFYYLRRQPLETGTSVYISMFDSNKFHNAEVKVVRREMVALEDGQEISTIIVEPRLKSEGLFQKSGEMLVWLTDDERRMPVRMEAKIKIGRVTAKLKSFAINPLNGI